MPLEFKKWTGKKWRYRWPCRCSGFHVFSLFPRTHKFLIRLWLFGALFFLFFFHYFALSLEFFFRGQHVCVAYRLSFCSLSIFFSLSVRSPVINSLVNLLLIWSKLLQKSTAFKIALATSHTHKKNNTNTRMKNKSLHIFHILFFFGG